MSNIQKIKLPETKPDCCRECKLLGIVPKGYPAPKYSKKTFLCLGALKAMTEDKTTKRESESNDPKHPLRRPCDEHWDRWLTNQNRIVCVNKALYRDSRDPYLAMIYPTIDFDD